MSGVKTSTVNTNNYRRHVNRNRQAVARFVNQQMFINYTQSNNQYIQKILNQSRQKEAERNKYLNDRITQLNNQAKNEKQHLNKVTSNLLNQLKEERLRRSQNEQNLHQRINALNDNLFKLNKKVDINQREVQNQLQNQRVEYTKAINSLRSEFREDLRRYRDEFNTRIKKLEESIAAKERVQKDLARDWIEACKEMYGVLIHTRHQYYVPGELERLERKIDDIDTDFRNGSYQAAISSGRNLLYEFSELENKIYEMEVFERVEIENAYFEYYQTLALYNAVTQSPYTISYGEDQQRIATKEEVELWSNGKVDEIRQRFKQQARLLSNENDKYDPSKWNRISQNLTELRSELDKLALDVTNNLTVAASRAVHAAEISEALEDMGFIRTDLAYEGNDPRNDMHIKFSSGIGQTAVVILKIDKEQPGLINVETHLYDDEDDDSFHQQITSAIASAVVANNNQYVVPPTSIPGYEHKSEDRNEFLDFDSLKKKHK